MSYWYYSEWAGKPVPLYADDFSPNLLRERIVFEAELVMEPPTGVWVTYSYDYYPYLCEIFLTEAEAIAYCSVGVNRYYIFLEFGKDLTDALIEAGRAVTENKL